ncbi:MAG: hypothetical protein AABY51_04065 [Deltaproteobacteria bacterium]
MDYYNLAIMLTLITAAASILNIPFGYFRANTKKFSVMWFLYIHLPIPIIFILRTSAGLSWKAIPVIVAGAVLGQVIGGRLNKKARAS